MDKTMKLFLLCVTFSTLLNTIFLTYSVLQSRRPATSYDHDQIVLTNVKYIERERATFIDDGPRWSVSWRFDQRTRCSQYSVVKLLIIIASNPERFSRRSAIRKTWAKASHLYRDADRRVVYLFLVNATSDRTLREQIASENDEHGDIIQSDQPSSLPNNTDLVSLAHWTKNYCANARFVLRVDDRTLVFTDRILSYLYGTEVANLQGSLPSEPSPQRRIEREGVLAYGFMTSYRPLPVTSQPYLLSSSVVHLIMTMSQFVEKRRLNNFTKSQPLLERVEALSTKIEGFGVYGEETRLCEHKSTLLLLCEVDFASMYAIWRDFEQNSCNTTTEEFTMSTKLRSTKTNDMLSAHATNASTSNNSQVNDLPSYRTGYTQCEAEYANKSNVFLLVLTYSEPGHLQERTAIRKTRGTLVSAMGRKIVQLFLIPGSPELTKNGTIQDESNLHKDIFILDVKDKKMPILKFLMMYNNFVVKLCPQYVMRVDDNFFVNLNSLVQVLVGAPRSRFFLSSTSNTSAKFKVKNNNLNFKQTVKYQSSHITDSVYVMSADVAADIYAASHHFDVICHPGTPDIGCLLNHLGISVVHHEGIDLSGKKRSLCETKEVLASGHVSESLMYAIWQNLDQWGAFISCSSDSELNLKREFDLNGDERIKIAGGRIVGMPPENRTTGSSSFLINHFEKCGSKVFLFVGILSRPGNQKLREIIRHTWAMYNEKIPGLRIETLFFIGVDKNLKIQNAIRKENQKYGDIIQVNFVDLYKNLVLKTLSIFHWAKHYCNNAKYLLKVDDDVSSTTEIW
ncbi:uncharacterized protein [Ptychodera flava]|uniref:uncharacterized protein n=1 Tax=Ptychodera flava TaxID=63121 RepID=UPI003969EF40